MQNLSNENTGMFDLHEIKRVGRTTVLHKDSLSHWGKRQFENSLVEFYYMVGINLILCTKYINFCYYILEALKPARSYELTFETFTRLFYFLIGQIHTMNSRNQHLWHHLAAYYTIIMSKTLKVTCNYFMHHCSAWLLRVMTKSSRIFRRLLSVKKHKQDCHFLGSMYNYTTIRLGHIQKD